VQRAERDEGMFAFHSIVIAVQSMPSIHAVHITCALRGEDRPPQNLEDVKNFTRSMIMSKPVPDWFLECLEELGEVEDTMTCSVIRVRQSSLRPPLRFG
jgi:hypothetical protein